MTGIFVLPMLAWARHLGLPSTATRTALLTATIAVGLRVAAEISAGVLVTGLPVMLMAATATAAALLPSWRQFGNGRRQPQPALASLAPAEGRDAA